MRTLPLLAGVVLLTLGPASPEAQSRYQFDGPDPATTDARPRPGLPEWTRLDLLPDVASGRMSAYVVHDPQRDRLVMFGGWGGSYYDDTWELRLSGPRTGWTLIAMSGPHPSARLEHSTVYDPLRHRMLLFGGKDLNRFFNDVWQLDLATDTWSPIVPAGTPPSPRETRAIYDPVRDRVVMYGGYGYPVHNDETWVLELAGVPTWRQLSLASSPPARRGHSAVYDSRSDRMLVFGGFDDEAFMYDLWALSLAGDPQWVQLSQTGRPSPRYGHSAVFDPARNEMLIFGGYHGAFLSDGHVLSLGSLSWAPLTGEPRPAARDFHSAVLDPGRGRMLLLHGNDGHVFGDWWSLDLSSRIWVQLGPPDPGPPQARLAHDGIYDPRGDRYVMFGGWDDHYLSDTWAMRLEGLVPVWARIATNAPRPSARIAFQTVYDSRRHRMLLIAGKDEAEEFNDVWSLDLATDTWSPVPVQGAPPVPREGRAIYDAQRDRVVLFGGYRWPGHLDDTWELDLSGTPTWRELVPQGPVPAARRGHTLVYDRTGNRMILFGGYDGGRFMSDLWELRLAGRPRWRQLEPEGTPPAARYGHSATYLPDRDQMVVFGGYGGQFLNDGAVLDLRGRPEWSPLETSGEAPVARDFHVMVYDAPHRRLLLHAGNAGVLGPVLDDLWQLDLGGRRPRRGGPHDLESEAVAIPDARLELAGFRPNPSLDAQVHFTLPSSAPAMLELFDLAGRRLASIRLDAPTPGPRSVRFEGLRLAPGVYSMRLTQAGLALTRRGVLMR